MVSVGGNTAYIYNQGIVGQAIQLTNSYLQIQTVTSLTDFSISM
jgi:hypothetical protein